MAAIYNIAATLSTIDISLELFQCCPDLLTRSLQSETVRNGFFYYFFACRLVHVVQPMLFVEWRNHVVKREVVNLLILKLCGPFRRSGP